MAEPGAFDADGPDPADPEEESDRPAREGADALPAGSPSEYARRALNRARSHARGQGLFPTAKGTPRRRQTGTTFSSAGRDGRDPQGFADVMRTLLSEFGWETGVAAGDVMERWDQIVGPNIAEHCRPVHFEDGVLTVQADSSAWAANIRMLRTQLISRIHEDVGKEVVVDLAVRGPATVSWVKGRRTVKGWRGPRDTYG